MHSDASTPDEYFANLPDDRKEPMAKLRKVIRKNLPKGFAEQMGYGSPGWVVPHNLYPAGYHCDPKQPLPFLGIASQKNNIALYHMGIYSDPELLEWFKTEWAKSTAEKLDMGKSCIRFKKLDKIPLDLIGKLVSKITPKQWIETYEKSDPRTKTKRL